MGCESVAISVAIDIMASESKTDVLIVGAGPAGLMMANWMAHCGIDARIVDKRGTKVCFGNVKERSLLTNPLLPRYSTAKQTG